MKPGEVGRLNRQKNTIAFTKANNMEIFTGWVNGKYVFKNTQFKEILRRLERLHNVQFVLEDKSLEDYNFDATFEDQNIDRIMEIFAVSLPIKWRSVKAEQNNDKTFSTRRIIISKDTSRELL
jgi:ferric-dicitrate binding protein FerR (iron transport regulator)